MKLIIEQLLKNDNDMYCENCGIQLRDGAKFCPNCGTACTFTPEVTSQEPAQASAPSPENEITTRVKLFPDGKYRWNYELNLVKNLTIFIDLIKVFGFILWGMWFIVEFIQIIKRDFVWDEFLINTKMFFWMSVFVFFLCLISYLLVIRINKRYYHLMFIMDEDGVTHCQRANTAKNGQLVAAAAVMMDTDNAAAAVAASQTLWKTRFPKVRRVKTVRRRQLIKVNEPLTKNRVYVENPEDYEFVLRYITERCPKVK